MSSFIIAVLIVGDFFLDTLALVFDDARTFAYHRGRKNTSAVNTGTTHDDAPNDLLSCFLLRCWHVRSDPLVLKGAYCNQSGR